MEKVTVCSCRWVKCKRHGNCDECIEHHKHHKKYPLPHCKNKSDKNANTIPKGRFYIMNGNAEMLNFIYQNSQMGVETIEHLASITEDKEFKLQLESQYREYEEIHRKARQMLNQNGYDEKGITAFEKIRTYLMINMQTLTDKSSSHIAEMLIIGSNMGIINAIKNIRKYSEAETDIVALMEKLQKFEENNIKQLKAYL